MNLSHIPGPAKLVKRSKISSIFTWCQTMEKPAARAASRPVSRGFLLPKGSSRNRRNAFHRTYRGVRRPLCAVSLHQYAMHRLHFPIATLAFRIQKIYWTFNGKLMSNLQTNARHITYVWMVHLQSSRLFDWTSHTHDKHMHTTYVVW